MKGCLEPRVGLDTLKNGEFPLSLVSCRDCWSSCHCLEVNGRVDGDFLLIDVA